MTPVNDFSILSIMLFILLVGAMGVIFYLLNQIRKNKEAGIKRENEMSAAQLRSDELLLNILPFQIAEELKDKGAVKARKYEGVSILFTDFKNFSGRAKQFSATDLVKEIDYLFRGFDHIMSKYDIEKIKTIGDAYMAATGLTAKNTNGAINIVRAAVEMNAFMQEYAQERQRKKQLYFQMRIGIHTGPVIAGVVGVRKFSFDIWGDTVNIAARMESAGGVDKINISQNTYEMIKAEKEFSFDYRGELEVKSIGKVKMYFVRG